MTSTPASYFREHVKLDNVLKSLQNRPQDWTVVSEGILHMPSGDAFFRDHMSTAAGESFNYHNDDHCVSFKAACTRFFEDHRTRPDTKAVQARLDGYEA
jgi:hypothetical protein